MEETITVEAKHIFIDIVNYTHNRSVEAQSDLIKKLNDIVKETILDVKIDEKEIIFIPTGDGMCISLINVKTPYDIHMRVAIELLKKLESYNQLQKDEMRKFSIRIGINENIDNLIIDINQRTNISGAGINMASRIEGLADFNQILVGRSVFDKLINREKYMKSFVPFVAKVKHDLTLNVYQFKDTNLSFLNNETPSIFVPQKQEKKKLDFFAGYYIALCLTYEEFIDSKIVNTLDISTLHSMIYLATLDKIGEGKITKMDPSYTKRIDGINDTVFKELRNNNIWLKHEIRFSLIPFKLSDYKDCFSEPYLLINGNGKNRLKLEQNAIFRKFKIK